MRKISLLLTFFMTVMATRGQSKKVALIVAVDNYPPESGWRNTWANADFGRLWDFFNNVQKFDVVDTLREAKATYVNIMKALDEMAAKCEKGGIAIFSFSGHGQQVFDCEDKSRGLFFDEADGYDEALVPYDAGSKYNEKTYKGEKHIRDEELETKLDLIRAKLGPGGSLLVMIDACHSGTITKTIDDNRAVRGTAGKIEPSGYKRKQSFPAEDFVMDKPRRSKALSPMVVLSGSAQDELNYPVPVGEICIGALTYSFLKAVQDLKAPFTYKELYESILQTILTKNNRLQRPVIDGPDSIAFLKNEFINAENKITLFPDINAPQFTDLALIDYGRMQGISEGMEFFVYPLNAAAFDSSKAVTRGYVLNTDPFNARVKLAKNINKEIPYQAVFLSKGYGNYECSFSIQGSSAALSRITEKLKSFSKYRVVKGDDPSDLKVKEIPAKITGQKKLIVYRTARTDSRYDTIWQKPISTSIEISDTDLDTLFRRIQLFTNANYMRNLNTPALDMSLREVKLIVNKVTMNNKILECDGNNILSSDNIRVVADPVLGPGKGYQKLRRNGDPNDTTVKYRIDGLSIKVVNGSEKPVYLSVLEITPDDSIWIRVPHAYCRLGSKEYIPKNSTEFRIAKGDSTTYLPKVLSFDCSPGLDFLKVIISDSPLNLTGKKAPSTKAGEMAIDNFFNEIFNADEYNKNSTRTKDGNAGQLVPVRAGSMKIISIPFILE